MSIREDLVVVPSFPYLRLVGRGSTFDPVEPSQIGNCLRDLPIGSCSLARAKGNTTTKSLCALS